MYTRLESGKKKINLENGNNNDQDVEMVVAFFICRGYMHLSVSRIRVIKAG